MTIDRQNQTEYQFNLRSIKDEIEGTVNVKEVVAFSCLPECQSLQVFNSLYFF